MDNIKQLCMHSQVSLVSSMTSHELIVVTHSRETLYIGIVLNMDDAREKKFTSDFFFVLKYSGKLEGLQI